MRGWCTRVTIDGVLLIAHDPRDERCDHTMNVTTDIVRHYPARMRRRVPARGSSGCAPVARNADAVGSFAEIVAHYLANYHDHVAAENAWYAKCTSLADTVERAALCTTENGKRHPHQTRIPQAVLNESYRKLQRCPFRRCRSFAELHNLVADKIGGLAGVGPLMVYDIAQRLGAYLKLEPQQVYLHRGVRQGARALGLGRGRETLEVRELPSEFQVLRATEIEDCLCIYKDQLAQITKPSASGSSSGRRARIRRQR